MRSCSISSEETIRNIFMLSRICPRVTLECGSTVQRDIWIYRLGNKLYVWDFSVCTQSSLLASYNARHQLLNEKMDAWTLKSPWMQKWSQQDGGNGSDLTGISFYFSALKHQLLLFSLHFRPRSTALYTTHKEDSWYIEKWKVGLVFQIG